MDRSAAQRRSLYRRLSSLICSRRSSAASLALAFVVHAPVVIGSRGEGRHWEAYHG